MVNIITSHSNFRGQGANNNRKRRLISIALVLGIIVAIITLVGVRVNKIKSEALRSEVQAKTKQIKVNPVSTTTTKTTMGYTKTVTKEGSGEKPAKGQYVTVHCTGYGKNRDINQKFWSTKDSGQEPFTFRVGMGEVIKAWDESVLTMSIGEQAKILATPDYAYGSSGFPAWGITPNSELLFEIEILKYSFTNP